ncbi:hypothetical protein EON65_33665 [archaeon]|nr:MAG: hypothetical protein EON65_33665 [archaeon]
MHINACKRAHAKYFVLLPIARSWVFCRHLALIVECFAYYGYLKQTKYFSTYRVDLIVALFARVIDVHNFELVVRLIAYVDVSSKFYALIPLSSYPIDGGAVPFRSSMYLLSSGLSQSVQPVQAGR